MRRCTHFPEEDFWTACWDTVLTDFRVAGDSLIEGLAGEMAILRQPTTSSPSRMPSSKSFLASTNLGGQAVIAGRETR